MFPDTIDKMMIFYPNLGYPSFNCHPDIPHHSERQKDKDGAREHDVRTEAGRFMSLQCRNQVTEGKMWDFEKAKS